MASNEQRNDVRLRARRRASVAPSLADRRVQTRLLALHSTTDMQTFLKSAVQLLHAAIPCDVVFSSLRCPGDGGRATAVWRHDCSVSKQGYLSTDLVGDRDLCILTVHLQANGDGVNGSEAECRPFSVPFAEGVAMRYSIALFFWNSSLDIVDLLLAPHRGSQMPDFSAFEGEMVQAIYSHIDVAYRRVSRLQNARLAHRGLEDFLAKLPVPTILLDWQLAPFYHNEAARRAASRWSGADPHLKNCKFRVPADLLGALKELPTRWVPGSVTFPERTIPHPTLPGFKAFISARAVRSQQARDVSFVIRFETNGSNHDARLAALSRLSPRERELAQMVCEGKSNQEIADALGRQLNTVKSELHSVFKKLLIPSRTRLMTLLHLVATLLATTACMLEATHHL